MAPPQGVVLQQNERMVQVERPQGVPAGTSIEGTGVIPDIKVPIDRDLLLTEGDPDIAAATRWIVSELDDPTS